MKNTLLLFAFLWRSKMNKKVSYTRQDLSRTERCYFKIKAPKEVLVMNVSENLKRVRTGA